MNTDIVKKLYDLLNREIMAFLLRKLKLISSAGLVTVSPYLSNIIQLLGSMSGK